MFKLPSKGIAARAEWLNRKVKASKKEIFNTYIFHTEEEISNIGWRETTKRAGRILYCFYGFYGRGTIKRVIKSLCIYVLALNIKNSFESLLQKNI